MQIIFDGEQELGEFGDLFRFVVEKLREHHHYYCHHGEGSDTTCEHHPHISHDHAITTLLVFDPDTQLYFEGENLSMNLKNTQQVRVTVKAKNRKGGPATGVTGTFSNTNTTSAYEVVPVDGDPLSADVIGNPESIGDEEDIGLVVFDGTHTAADGSTPAIHAELAINILAADADTIDMIAGTPTEQA